MSHAATEHFELAETVARSMIASVRCNRIYAPQHQRTIRALDHLVAELHSFLDSCGSALTLTVGNGMLAFGGIPLESSGSGLDLLASLIEERNCGGIKMSREAGLAEMQVVVAWLAKHPPQSLTTVPAGIELLVAGGEGPGSRQESASLDRVPEFKISHRIHRTAHSVLEHIMEDAHTSLRLEFDEILELTRWTSEEVFEQGPTLLAATQNYAFDRYTFNHSVNVFLIATALLQPIARDPEELARFAQAALLHDVGKSLVPREIVTKRDMLTDEEFAEMQRHTWYGARILQQCKHVDPIAVEVAYCHHMRDDGLGYPKTTLPVSYGPVTSIVQVADMFEALTSPRPYRKRLNVQQTLERLQATPGMGSKKAAIEAFFQRLTEHPVGSQVRLSTGESGIVIRTRSDAPDRPKVRVHTSKEDVALASPFDLDLFELGPEAPTIVQVDLKPTRQWSVS